MRADWERKDTWRTWCIGEIRMVQIVSVCFSTIVPPINCWLTVAFTCGFECIEIRVALSPSIPPHYYDNAIGICRLFLPVLRFVACTHIYLLCYSMYDNTTIRNCAESSFFHMIFFLGYISTREYASSFFSFFFGTRYDNHFRFIWLLILISSHLSL